MLQWGILDNERKFNLVMLRRGLEKVLNCKLLMLMMYNEFSFRKDLTNIRASSRGNTERSSVSYIDWV